MKKVGLCINKPIDIIELKHTLNKYGLTPATDKDKDIEFMLSVGGDGAVLRAMDIAISLDVPILGYHTGTLGFLTSGDSLTNLLELWKDDKLNVEERLLLEVRLEYPSLSQNQRNELIHIAMNEVAIVSNAVGSLLINKVDIDGQYVTTYKGDGLCISTPSGSTAWNLSAGGPILHPSVESIVLTPMNPFTLSNRPLVVASDSIIHIEAGGQILIDGKRIAGTCSSLELKRYKKKVKLMLQEDHCFFKSIRSKLGWNNNIKQ